MPVLDGDFEAFVTNLGKYNEGMLVGEWLKLPTTEEEILWVGACMSQPAEAPHHRRRDAEGL